MPTTEFAEQAQATLDYLEEHGWHQRPLIGPHGEACLLAAMVHADAVSMSMVLAGQPFYDAVREVVGQHVGFWNDMPGRTKEDVYQLLEQFGAKRHAT